MRCVFRCLLGRWGLCLQQPLSRVAVDMPLVLILSLLCSFLDAIKDTSTFYCYSFNEKKWSIQAFWYELEIFQK